MKRLSEGIFRAASRRCRGTKTSAVSALLVLRCLFLFCLGVPAECLSVDGVVDYVWWEGEAATTHNFNSRDFNPLHFGRKRWELSKGLWLYNGGIRGKDEVFATYVIDVPSTGPYYFWTRKFWYHGPFKWRFDSDEWKENVSHYALADNFTLAPHITVNWVYLDQVQLTKGKHTFELRLLANEGELANACFDSFLLTPHLFQPNGFLKPGQENLRHGKGWWPFSPPIDTFSADSAFDLRYLNESVAGESGFITRAEDKFRRGDGQPVRFWSVNCTPSALSLGKPQVDYLARRLAKVGVNMVRCHGPLWDRSSPVPAVDTVTLDQLFYFVSAMKKQGIYTALSFYFPLWLAISANDGIAGYDDREQKQPFSLLFFNEKMQEIYRAWAKIIFTTINPYTQQTLADDSSLALIELINEDSLLFWTFNDHAVPPAQMEILENRFGEWLAAIYGNLEKAVTLWPQAAHPRDDVAHTRAGLYSAGDMQAGGLDGSNPNRQQRMSLQLRFLTESMHRFYGDMRAYLKDVLGCKSLVVAGNWHTVDALRLDPLERYSYTAGDVIDRHGYFPSIHEGQRASYSVSAGDTFTDIATVKDPVASPLGIVQVAGYPQIVSETGAQQFNRQRADQTFLTSAYGSLQGISGYCWFAVNTAWWSTDLEKFPVSVPSVMGQFPAAALQYRRGDVAEGPIVVRETLSFPDLYAFRGSRVAENEGLDPLRAADTAEGSNKHGPISPMAFFVGRVLRGYGTEAEITAADLEPYITHHTVKSATGELFWNYADGYMTVNAPKSQGCTGFLGEAGEISLNDVIIESTNEFATIHVISLDDAPLSSSRKILIQAFTDEQPYGFTVRDGRITDLGTTPLNVRNIEATVKIKSASAIRATQLDPLGYPKQAVTTSYDGTVAVIPLPQDSLYTLVERIHE